MTHPQKICWGRVFCATSPSLPRKYSSMIQMIFAFKIKVMLCINQVTSSLKLQREQLSPIALPGQVIHDGGWCHCLPSARGTLDKAQRTLQDSLDSINLKNRVHCYLTFKSHDLSCLSSIYKPFLSSCAVRGDEVTWEWLRSGSPCAVKRFGSWHLMITSSTSWPSSLW